MIRYGTAVYPM